MLLITFKNGKNLKVTQEIANIISNRIIEGVNKPFQCFIDKNDVFSIINISEIVCMEYVD